MPFRDILVHIDDSPLTKVRLALAARLAAVHQGHLAGLYVRYIPRMPAYVAAQMGAEVHRLQDRFAGEAAARARQTFDEVTAAAGIAAEWRMAEGEVVDALATHARYADLTVVGQTDPDADDRTSIADSLVLDAGRPVLVVPYAGHFDRPMERVLIAWNASRESTRAVNDALPFLQAAKKVTVLAVNPTGGGGSHGDVPGADICLHLARHGVNAEAATLKAADMEVGDILLSRVADGDADLLVMGAYGRSRLREVVLGGASRHILDHMTVPVLMSH